ncbi:hypothetical protein Pan44_01460 [Caulifigura coniformis]|uniref:Apolipoprotein A1/A4/E domain protein n=1 Tax=Caulifigura coniformis TaxID=2527983 RepID=A0A517S7P1_9PLAN|nr:hypothetical protein [Caulifigura coniformis]QDT52137.1 hypothetical protein Pan44_01460 [Caulifigura coniformis]
MRRLFPMCLAGLLAATGCSKAEVESAKKDAEAAAAKAEAAADQATAAAKEAGDKAADVANTALEKGKELASQFGGEFGAAFDKAKAAVADVKGGPELMADFSRLLDSSKQTLEGITSSETAQTAMGKLTEIEGTIDGLGAKLKDLPEGAKTAIVAMVDKGAAFLRTLVDKAKALPGVGDDVKASFDKFLAKLESLKS